MDFEEDRLRKITKAREKTEITEETEEAGEAREVENTTSIDGYQLNKVFFPLLSFG